uniref:uncharacterized protein n=1 Tax=Myxine glutinosa TaxID=7769 RepID=UPI00358E2D47
MAWSGAHHVFAVEAFFTNNRSVIAVQRAFRRRFSIPQNQSVPDRKTILQWVENFRATGSALKRKSPGRPRSARMPENIEALRRSVVQSPRRSARKHALAEGISRETARRILHKDLHFHPYKMTVVQELNARDWISHRELRENILQCVPEDAVLLWSDKAHFHLSGSVNKQNYRYWSEDNPRILHERPLHSDRVTVWCAVADVGIVGPYFFEEGGVTVTVTSDRYIDMLENFLRPQLEHLELEELDVWFQQDGATAHTARRSLQVLREMFPDRVISLRGDVGWPVRSPDLAPCDFFLWGNLKSRVYTHRPQTLEALKVAIQAVFDMKWMLCTMTRLCSRAAFAAPCLDSVVGPKPPLRTRGGASEPLPANQRQSEPTGRRVGPLTLRHLFTLSARVKRICAAAAGFRLEPGAWTGANLDAVHRPRPSYPVTCLDLLLLPAIPCRGQERRYSSHSSSNTLSSTGSSSASEERWGPAGEGCRDAEAGNAPVTPAALDSGIDTTTPRGTPLAIRAASRAASGRVRGQAYTPAEERSELLSGSPTMQSSVQGGKTDDPVEQGKAVVGDRAGSTPTSYYSRQGSGIFLRGWKKPDSSSNLDCRRRMGSDVSDAMSWARQKATASAKAVHKSATGSCAADGRRSGHSCTSIQNKAGLPSTVPNHRLQRTHSDESLCQRDGSLAPNAPSMPARPPADDCLYAVDAEFSTPMSKVMQLPPHLGAELLVERSDSEESLPEHLPLGLHEDRLLPLPDTTSGLDWAHLVDAARAFEDHHSAASSLTGLLDVEDIEPIGTPDASGRLSPTCDMHRLPSPLASGYGCSRCGHMSREQPPRSLSMKVNHLERILKQLQDDLQKEKKDKAELQAELEHLRDDNYRLQQESQTAATQLRKFTEWFFNAIDKK